MPKIAMLNQEGAKVGEIELSEAIFASEINESVLHLVVRSQLAAKRQGTQSAKTRGEVRGGGRKIYRQKGTGNARHHGNRAPQFTAPKTREVAKILKNLGVEKTALLVLAGPDDTITRASANIAGLKTVYVNTINVLDILGNEKFIITEEAVKLVEEVYA